MYKNSTGSTGLYLEVIIYVEFNWYRGFAQMMLQYFLLPVGHLSGKAYDGKKIVAFLVARTIF